MIQRFIAVILLALALASANALADVPRKTEGSLVIAPTGFYYISKEPQNNQLFAIAELKISLEHHTGSIRLGTVNLEVSVFAPTPKYATAEDLKEMAAAAKAGIMSDLAQFEENGMKLHEMPEGMNYVTYRANPSLGASGEMIMSGIEARIKAKKPVQNGSRAVMTRNVQGKIGFFIHTTNPIAKKPIIGPDVQTARKAEKMNVDKLDNDTIEDIIERLEKTPDLKLPFSSILRASIVAENLVYKLQSFHDQQFLISQEGEAGTDAEGKDVVIKREDYWSKKNNVDRLSGLIERLKLARAELSSIICEKNLLEIGDPK